MLGAIATGCGGRPAAACREARMPASTRRRAASAPCPALPPAASEAFPSAGKRMTEAGISAAEIGAGSGKDGRITKGDVLDFLSKPQASKAAAPAPAPKAARVG